MSPEAPSQKPGHDSVPLSEVIRQRAADLFPGASPVVTAALKRFLKRNPGTFDLRNLELVAAAAPSFTDPNHVSLVIDQLPVTQMQLAVAPVDRALAEERFKAILPNFRPTTSRKLLLELLTTSTLTIIEDSPMRIVPEAARELIRADLATRFKTGDPMTRLEVVGHRYVTPEIVTAVLDRVEEAIPSATPGDPSYVANVRLVRKLFSGAAAETATDEQLLRAWKIVERFEPDSETLAAVCSAAKVSRLVRQVGDSMVEWLENCSDEVDKNKSRADALNTLLQSSVLPEPTARRIVRAFPENKFKNNLLSTLRQHHYRSTEDLLPQMTSGEVDVRIADLLTRGDLDWALVEQTSDPTALDVLVERIDELDKRLIDPLVANNSHFEPRQLVRIIERLQGRSNFSADDISFLTAIAISSPDADDVQLNELVTRFHDQGVMRDRALELAALRENCGPLIFDQIVRRQAELDTESEHAAADVPGERRSLMRLVAINSASPYVHRAISQIAIQANDDSLARSLMANGTLRVDTLRELKSTFGDMAVDVQRRSHGFYFATFGAHQAAGFGYTASHVLDLIASGDAPLDRAARFVNDEVTILKEGTGTVHPSKHATAVLSMMQAGLVEDKLPELTGHPDRHRALDLASRLPPTSDQCRFRLPAESALAETKLVLDEHDMKLPPDKGLRSWSQLPNADSILLEPSTFHRLFEGMRIGDLVLETPKSRRDVRELSRYMHNCLDGFTDDIAKGTAVLAYARAADDTYAVLWKIERAQAQPFLAVPPETAADDMERASEVRAATVTPSLRVGFRAARVRPASAVEGFRPDDVVGIRVVEVNSRFNKNAVPIGFKNEIDRLTLEINLGRRSLPSLPEVAENASLKQRETSQRTERVPAVAEDHEGVEPPVVRRQAVRHPPRRTAVPALTRRVEQTRRVHETAPSMLTSPSDGATHDSASDIPVEPVVDAENRHSGQSDIQHGNDMLL